MARRWNFQHNWKGVKLEQLKAGLKEAKTEYHKMKPEAASKRDEFYSRLAIERAMDDGLKLSHT